MSIITGITLPPIDSEGSAILRVKSTQAGWHYEPRSLDWITAKYESLYNRKHDGPGIDDGTDYEDALLKFYDLNGDEIVRDGYDSDESFQVALDINCVQTIMTWQPQYDMDVIGGIFQILNPPEDRAYLWVVVAPDIPEFMGGSVPFAAGGWALHHFKQNDTLTINGRGSKRINVDNVHNTNKFALICKHSPGTQIGLQMVFEHFKE